MKRQCPATSCDDHTLALTNLGGPQLLSRAVDDCRLRLGSGARQRVRGALEIQAASCHGMRLLHQEASKTPVRGGWLRVQGPPCFSASCRPPTGVPKRHAISGFKLGVLHCLGSLGCVAVGGRARQAESGALGSQAESGAPRRADVCEHFQEVRRTLSRGVMPHSSPGCRGASGASEPGPSASGRCGASASARPVLTRDRSGRFGSEGA